MSQVARVSPQLSGDGRSCLVVSESTVAVHTPTDDVLGEYDSVFPVSTEDSIVIAQTKQRVLPLVVQRQNVVLLFVGHASSGKTSLFEQLLPSIVEGLKAAIISADEAHNEAISVLGSDSVRSRRQNLPGDSISPCKQMTNIDQSQAEVSKSKTQQRKSVHGTTSQVLNVTSAAIPEKKGSEIRASSASPCARSKYSLLMARLPRSDAAIELSEVDTTAICGKPLLPPLDSGSLSEGSDSPTQEERSPSRWRMMIERSRSPISLTYGHTTTLGAKNGRSSGLHQSPIFDGKSTMLLHSTQEVDKLLKLQGTTTLSFWIVMDKSALKENPLCPFHVFDPHDANFSLFMMLSANDLGMYENGSILIVVRDTIGKRLEMCFQEQICDGKWHHIAVDVKCTDKHLLLWVDGKACRGKVCSMDNLTSFHESRSKQVVFGARCEFADGAVSFTDHFVGSLMDFTITHSSGKRIMHFSMRDEQHGYEDQCFLHGALEGTTVYGEIMFPQTSPVFDGFEHFVNVSPVGDLGLMFPGTAFEICFRTSVTNERMCLMGVVDSMGKHPGFSIELNTNGQGSLQRYMFSFFVSDRSGASVRLVAEISDAFDDHWHSLSIRIVDWAGHKIKFRLDNRPVEGSLYGTGQPHDFVSYTQYVAVGALNCRGSIRRHFRGSIKHAKILRVKDEVEEPLATWLFSEGPGGIIAMDSTSHGGVFARSPGAWASRQPRATRGVMMRAGFREAGALKQHVTGSFHARTLARGGPFGNRVDGCVDCARTVLLLT